jgi:hypothetical protein
MTERLEAWGYGWPLVSSRYKSHRRARAHELRNWTNVNHFEDTNCTAACRIYQSEVRLCKNYLRFSLLTANSPPCNASAVRPHRKHDHSIPDRCPRNLQSLLHALETRAALPIAHTTKRALGWHEDRVQDATPKQPRTREPGCQVQYVPAIG